MCRMCPGDEYQCLNCGHRITPPKVDTLYEEKVYLGQRGWVFLSGTGSRDYCSAFCAESNWPYGWWEYEKNRKP
jgi:hypothetical protein